MGKPDEPLSILFGYGGPYAHATIGQTALQILHPGEGSLRDSAYLGGTDSSRNIEQPLVLHEETQKGNEGCGRDDKGV
jgi:hypothetical protein